MNVFSAICIILAIIYLIAFIILAAWMHITDKTDPYYYKHKKNKKKK